MSVDGRKLRRTFARVMPLGVLAALLAGAVWMLWPAGDVGWSCAQARGPAGGAAVRLLRERPGERAAAHGHEQAAVELGGATIADGCGAAGVGEVGGERERSEGVGVAGELGVGVEEGLSDDDGSVVEVGAVVEGG